MKRLPRKLKKRIVNTFGRGTYQGIIEGILTIVNNTEYRGSHVIYTEKGIEDGGVGSRFYHPHQYHPFLTFKKIK